jgi:hypothetical protein
VIRALPIAALLALTPGCVSMMDSSKGRLIDPVAVGKIERGKSTLSDVLLLLGAPLEVHDHVDGRLLLFRRRASHSFYLELSANQVLRFVDASQVLSEILGNLSLTLEWLNHGEDRVAVLLDDEGVVQGVGSKFVTANLPWF